MTSSDRPGSGLETRHEVPDLVAAYVRRCVGPRPRPAGGTVLAQRGEMRLGPGRPWMPFTAEQTIAASRTELTGRAHVRMSPLVSAVVVDGYPGLLTTVRREAVEMPVDARRAGSGRRRRTCSTSRKDAAAQRRPARERGGGQIRRRSRSVVRSPGYR